MNLGPIKLPKTSVALLAIQIVLVSSIAARYLYQRHACPRAWTRAVAAYPDLLMRGRYLSLQLVVDGCQSTLPSARQATFQRNIDGSANHMPYSMAAAPQPITFPANLTVQSGKLIAIRIPATGALPAGQMVSAFPGQSCDAMRLAELVNFFIAEHATSPLPLKPGAELWIEVTVPPKGPPRPLQLALKQDGAWKPLAFQ